MPRHPILLLLLILIPAHSLFSATVLTTLSGERTALADILTAPETLVLIVSNENELSEAQRLLTVPNKNRRTFIIIELPSNQPTKANLMRKAASRFFKSDISHDRIYLATDDQLEFTSAKSLLFTKKQTDPIWKSSELAIPWQN